MLVSWMLPVGHPGRAKPEQLPVNSLDSTTPTPTTDHRHHPVASCKPHTGVRLPFRHKGRPAGAAIAYQRDDGQRGRHWRNPDKRRNPNVTGDGWQLRRFDPVDPSSAVAICLSEGEKDSALLATAGLIAFCGPRGAQSLPGADFSELAQLAKETHLPVLLIGDNDLVGREAMRKVRSQLKKVSHLDATDLTKLAQEKSSVADLPTADLLALIRLELLDRDPSWQKPGRNRAMYQQFKCPRPKKNIKSAGDGKRIRGVVPCGNLSTCKPCCEWENFLHIERCWRGTPAQFVVGRTTTVGVVQGHFPALPDCLVAVLTRPSGTALWG